VDAADDAAGAADETEVQAGVVEVLADVVVLAGSGHWDVALGWKMNFYSLYAS